MEYENGLAALWGSAGENERAIYAVGAAMARFGDSYVGQWRWWCRNFGDLPASKVYFS